jgi:hypothetical protein
MLIKTLIIILLLASTCQSKRESFVITDCGNTIESPYLADDLIFSSHDILTIAVRFIQLKKIPQESTIERIVYENAIDSLNKSFTNTNIRFALIDGHNEDEVKNINNDVIVMGKDLKMSDYKSHILLYKREHSTDLPAIDVFVYPVDFDYYPGVALAIKSDGVAIQKIFINSNTLTHEIGHCLGLNHTHQEGGNGYLAGDFICDTPATGQIGNLIDGNCNPKRNTGLSDEEIKIIIHNYMTYVNKGCRREFTKDQIDRMRFNISKEPMLRETLIF